MCRYARLRVPACWMAHYAVCNKCGHVCCLNVSHGRVLQAYIVSYFELAAVLWTTVIAHTLHQSLHNPQASLGVHKRMKKYHMHDVWALHRGPCTETHTAVVCLPAAMCGRHRYC